MIDSGVVCRGTFQGQETIGIRLNWHKRYITLGPIATPCWARVPSFTIPIT